MDKNTRDDDNNIYKITEPHHLENKSKALYNF